MGPPGVCVCTGEFRVAEINRRMAQVMKVCGLTGILSRTANLGHCIFVQFLTLMMIKDIDF
jgi:hypothetical protein